MQPGPDAEEKPSWEFGGRGSAAVAVRPATGTDQAYWLGSYEHARLWVEIRDVILQLSRSRMKEGRAPPHGAALTATLERASEVVVAEDLIGVPWHALSLTTLRCLLKTGGRGTQHENVAADVCTLTTALVAASLIVG